MNRKIKTKMLLFILTAIIATPLFICAQEDSVVKELVLNVNYHMNNNKVIYLLTNAKTKVKGKFKPAEAVPVNLFLDGDSAGNLISRVITDKEGNAKAFLPAALKIKWESSSTHTFTAVSEKTKDFEPANAEIAVTKSRITIDTLTDGETKKITVSVTAFNGTNWLPVKDVEMKIGIGRLSGSILTAGEEETYTTDSSGTATAELNKTNLPGDAKGNFVLTAKVDENEQIGNLLIEKTVPWGAVLKQDSGFFNQRTLWTTRFKTPYWLLFMAYSIITGVWGTIIYLIMQIIKIKKLGKAAGAEEKI